METRAAEFLVSKFKAIHSQSGRATQQPRQKKHLTTWLLPNLFGNQVSSYKQSAPSRILLSGKVIQPR